MVYLLLIFVPARWGKVQRQYAFPR
jgi:hypothetical protein